VASHQIENGQQRVRLLTQILTLALVEEEGARRSEAVALEYLGHRIQEIASEVRLLNVPTIADGLDKVLDGVRHC
jgi:hypothetical protein